MGHQLLQVVEDFVDIFEGSAKDDKLILNLGQIILYEFHSFHHGVDVLYQFFGPAFILAVGYAGAVMGSAVAGRVIGCGPGFCGG